MNDWIDVHALLKVIIGALICGAGLPALFAVGLRALHLGAPDTGRDDVLVGRNPLGLALATVCFAVVAFAIGYGIYLIVQAS
jgi:hypothetical protein